MRFDFRKTRWALGTVAGSVLAGCTTYVEGPPPPPPPPVAYESAPPTYYPPRPAYEPPPAAVEDSPPDGEVVIAAESDFYQPLQPYGEWVEIDGYGQCWRPRNIDAGWRPYANGHWQRTEAGWYWVSAEPWGWATYHYGRWNFDDGYGWYWVPQTQWAPAWVAWREGGGYAGWAPLPPRARPGVRINLNVDIAPRAFVFVEERRFAEPVRTTTVIVNNPTIINRTVNITNTTVVNRTVVNAGPRTEVIERVRGRAFPVATVRQMRSREEAPVAAKFRGGIQIGSPAGPQRPQRQQPAPYAQSAQPRWPEGPRQNPAGYQDRPAAPPSQPRLDGDYRPYGQSRTPPAAKQPQPTNSGRAWSQEQNPPPPERQPANPERYRAPQPRPPQPTNADRYRRQPENSDRNRAQEQNQPGRPPQAAAPADRARPGPREGQPQEPKGRPPAKKKLTPEEQKRLEEEQRRAHAQPA